MSKAVPTLNALTPPSARRRVAASLVALALSGLVAGCMPGGGLAGMSASAGNMFSTDGATAGRSTSIFVASTRKGDSRVPGESVADGGAHYALSIVSVPPGHKAGEIEEPAFGSVDPRKHFAVVGGRGLEPEDFRLQVATYLSGRVGSNRDILLYVHGFNTSLEEARFRLAQLVNDGRFGGVPVLFTWPSQSNMFSYVSDKESATVSRDALRKVISDLSKVEGVGRVHVLAHSMGAWLAMEALRENALSGSRNLDGRLGAVMLAAPDIDLNVFRTQLARVPSSNVSIFVSSHDRALSLSSRLAGARPRVGALDPGSSRDRAELTKLGVKVFDLSAASSGFIGHSVYGDAPLVVRTIGAQLSASRREDAGVTSMIDGNNMPPVAASTTPLGEAASAASETVRSSPLPPLAPVQ
ncbi:MAG: alpha/beta fold hydrolase [Beijerinckiaceae bacterium]|nr:alpha/beta fold hydrolase [Beijerinckiaceae bacterium]